MYTCEECGNEFTKEQLEPESFSDGDYYCFSCSNFLAEVADEFLNG